MDDRRLAHRPFVVLLTPLVFLVLLLASCTAAEDRLGAVPEAPAQARELTVTEVPFDPDAVAEDFKASLDASTVHIRVYSLPVGTTFAQLVGYYENLLPGPWIQQSPEALETTGAPDRNAVIWTSDATREIVSLQYVAAPGLEGNVLVVIYAQRR